MRSRVRGTREHFSLRIAVLALLFGTFGTADAAPRKITTKLVLLDAPVFCLWKQSWMLVKPGMNALFVQHLNCTPSTKHLLVELGKQTVRVPPKGKVINIQPMIGQSLAVRFQRVLIPPQWLKAGGKKLAEQWVAFPAKVSRIKLGRDRLDCIDLNGDGRYWRIGEDAIVYEGSRYAVPLRDQIIVGRVRHRWRRIDDSCLEIVETEPMVGIDGSEDEIVAACRWNDYRVRAGLPPAWLSPKLSADCAKHCKYLQLNQGGNSHDEIEGRPGFTDAGRTAAQNSCVGHGPSARRTLLSMLGHLFHKRPLVHPDMRRMGIAARHGKTLLDGKRGRSPSKRSWQWPICVPGHEQTTAVYVYTGSERPNPVPLAPKVKTGACIVVAFPWHQPNMESATGQLWMRKGKKWNSVATYFSSPNLPATKHFPKNYDCIGLFPKYPLAKGATYRVRITYARRGKEARALEWVFHTE